jgi:hypothetical protein
MSFEKMKARYICNGKRQDRNQYDPFSLRADTVDTASVFQVAGIIAHQCLNPFSADKGTMYIRLLVIHLEMIVTVLATVAPASRGFSSSLQGYDAIGWNRNR